MRKHQYYECPYCHAHLDYGERCDCRDRAEKKEPVSPYRIRVNLATGQMELCLDGKMAGEKVYK